MSMRNGHDNGILLDAEGRFLGVNLGADFCAEHEWGITDLQEKFGVAEDEKVFGLSRRLIHRVPALLAYVSREEKAVGTGYKKGTKLQYEGLFLPAYKEQELHISTYYELHTAWDEKSLMAVSRVEKDWAGLKELLNAIKEGDAAIWLGGGGVFKRAGLCLAVASRLAPEVLELWESTDRERYETKQAMLASGIEAELKAAGKKYFALSPRRDPDGMLRFWLNPMEQRENNSGWYTLGDLRDWINGRGPIPKKKEQEEANGTV